MKIKHSWSADAPRDVSTSGLVAGDHCESIDDRVARLEKIIAALIDELELSDEQKKRMLQYQISPFWEFVEDKP
jgi:hypothetical protein